jgi:hypothetical protein
VQGVRAAGMSPKVNNHARAMAAHMTMAHAGSMPMCNKCDGCKNGSCKSDGCLSSRLCSACCGNLAALPVFGMVIGLPLRETGYIRPLLFLAGWAAPPDPYPPRTNILS